jgi:hypothetical protein
MVENVERRQRRRNVYRIGGVVGSSERKEKQQEGRREQ